MKYLGTRNKQYDPVVTQDISGKQDKATLEADVAAKARQRSRTFPLRKLLTFCLEVQHDKSKGKAVAKSNRTACGHA